MTIELTPSQKRLIEQARTQDDFRVFFFGVPEKTRQKLLDAGVVETVPTHSDEERQALKDEVKALCNALIDLVNVPSPKYHTEQTARNILHTTSLIFSTKDVLTPLWQSAEGN